MSSGKTATGYLTCLGIELFWQKGLVKLRTRCLFSILPLWPRMCKNVQMAVGNKYRKVFMSHTYNLSSFSPIQPVETRNPLPSVYD